MTEKVIKINLDNLKSQRHIVLYASDRQIEEIKTLVGLKDNNAKKVGDNLYELSISSIKVSGLAILDGITLGDISGEPKPRMVDLIDFNKSEEFYEGSRKKKGYKIVSDEFSDDRNRNLYKGFQAIESKWRTLILSTYSNRKEKTPKSKYHNKRSSDHAISTYGLTGFFELFLYQPASELYMRNIWKSSNKTEDDVIRISNLKQINELGFGLNKEELEIIRQRRNQCMHFRVITQREYEEVVPIINKYLKKDEWNRFVVSFKATTDEMMKRLIPDMNNITNAMTSLIRSQMPSINDTANSIKRLSESFMNINRPMSIRNNKETSQLNDSSSE